MAAKVPHPKPLSGSYDLADIRMLAKVLSQYDLSEVEVEANGQRIRLRRERGSAPSPLLTTMLEGSKTSPAGELALAHPLPAPEPDIHALITSPFVGTFYRAPSPDASVFVEIGQTVKKGQVLCIVEAMKLMNEIEAETDCKIVDILVKNAEPVEFGQPLFKVLPVA